MWYIFISLCVHFYLVWIESVYQSYMAFGEKNGESTRLLKSSVTKNDGTTYTKYGWVNKYLVVTPIYPIKPFRIFKNNFRIQTIHLANLLN